MATEVGMSTSSRLRRAVRRPTAGLAALSATSHPIVITDHTRNDNPIVYVNAAFRALTGYRESELLGRNCRLLQGPDTDQVVIAELSAALKQGQSIRRELLNYRKDGSTFWNQVTIDPIRSPLGQITGFVGLQQECDTAHRLSDEKVAADAVLASITDHLPGYIYKRIMRPDGSIELAYTSPSLRRLLGFDDQGPTPSLSDHIHADDVEPILAAIRKSAANLSIYRDEFRLIAIDNSVHWMRSESMPRLTSDGDTIWDGMAVEISAEKRWENEVTTLATRDTLTGLLSRGAWRQVLSMRLAETTEARGCALLYVDLRGFHDINERFGTQGGDDVLGVIGQRLSEFAASIDGVAARLGGDEFAVMINACSGADVLASLGQSLSEAIALPITLGDQTVAMQVAMGATLHAGMDGPEITVRELKTQAEHALRWSKRDSTSAYKLYSPDQDERFSNVALLTAALESSIINGELSLHYQPLVDLASGEIVSAEALLRWNHPTLGSQRPDIFIPLAEKSGFILELGRWVFEEVLRQRKLLTDIGLTVPPISINVSGSQLTADLGAIFGQCLAEHGGHARDYELELTESLLIEASPEVMSCLADLRDMGFSIAIDDFGSGHSTFRYLRDFPVDTLKLDQTYVRKLVLDSTDAQIIRAVIALARGMGIAFIAEGIETEMQRDFLQREGCEIGQGYLFSRPLPASEFAQLLSV